MGSEDRVAFIVNGRSWMATDLLVSEIAYSPYTVIVDGGLWKTELAWAVDIDLK